MTAPLVKGWCPGAIRPMQSGDGLVVRIRLTAGRLPADRAVEIARLATAYGNGRIDLTQRGNLQLRGVTAATLPALHATLAALHLLDADGAVEARRNLVVSPMAGASTVALAEAIETALAEAHHLDGLPAKFGFILDDGTWPRPAGIGFDVAFVADGPGWAVLLPAPAGGFAVATLAAEAVPATAVRLAATFLAKRGAARRMAALTATPEAARAVAAAAGLAAGAAFHPAPAVPEGIGRRGAILGVGVPFGQMDAAQLTALAAVAAQGDGFVRLTPFRAVLLAAAPADAEAVLEQAGLILDPADPRRAVVACTGAPACSSAHQPARATAAALAPLIAAWPGAGIRLHVSGCAKGCARPGKTALTLVGKSNGYDLVLDGTTLDRPMSANLDPATLADALAELKAP